MWLDIGFHDQYQAGDKLDKTGREMNAPTDSIDSGILDRIHRSIIGLALGYVLRAHAEFRPHQYFVHKSVMDLQSGGIWCLEIGQVCHFLI